jgi:hypothetical protein
MNESEFLNLSKEEFLVWFYNYAREEHKGDLGLALLELELQGMI